MLQDENGRLKAFNKYEEIDRVQKLAAEETENVRRTLSAEADAARTKAAADVEAARDSAAADVEAIRYFSDYLLHWPCPALPCPALPCPALLMSKHSSMAQSPVLGCLPEEAVELCVRSH